MANARAILERLYDTDIVILRGLAGIALGLPIVYAILEFSEWRMTRKGKNLERMLLGMLVASLVMYGMVGVGWVKP
jgi:4-amino-4-deoxy-L-arabinose transferase-like glycosyltransferase